MAEKNSPRALFWVFCLVTFSKIVWYDLRVYVDPAARRSFLTLCFAVWILAQVLVYLPIVKPMLRQVPKSAIFWVVAVAPYFALGLFEGRVNAYLLADVARYSLPLGYLLFGVWAVRKVPISTILTATTVSLASLMALRTVVHWVLAPNTVRYGVHWEVVFLCLLISLSLVTRRWRFLALLLGIAGAIFAVSLGQTRSVLLGIAMGGGVCGLIALPGLRFTPRRNLRLLVAAGLASVVALVPLVVPSNLFQRSNLAKVVGDSDVKLLAEAFGSSDSSPRERVDPEAAGRNEGSAETSQPPTTPAVPVAPTVTAPTTPKAAKDPQSWQESADLQAALRRWERAIAAGGRSLDVRLLEAQYFLGLMKRDAKSLFLGAGAGSFVTVKTPDTTRIVRGAHITYVTLLYRHGVLAGLLLSLFVTFYGLPTNLRQLRSTDSQPWRVLLIGLIAYRCAAIGMAQLHQGLFDDPMVFLSMAIAISPGAQTREAGTLEGLPGPTTR